MERNIIYNEKMERMFDIVKEEGVPKLELKVGKGKHSFRYMDARDVIKEIKKVIKD